MEENKMTNEAAEMEVTEKEGKKGFIKKAWHYTKKAIPAIGAGVAGFVLGRVTGSNKVALPDAVADAVEEAVESIE